MKNNPKYSEYIIVNHYSQSCLVNEVNDYLKKGYEPLGAPFQKQNSSDFFQALILRTDALNILEQ